MNKKEIKEKRLKEFQKMKSLEEKAYDFYNNVSLNPKVGDYGKNIFKEISIDEKEHSLIVQKIINIISNTL